MNVSDSILMRTRSEDVQKLERGSAVCRFQARHRPERGKLYVRRETCHLIFQTNQSKEIIATLLEVKDFKRGKACKDFEKWSEESCRYDANKCFTVYYTSEFKYKTLSVGAISDRECQAWIRGLQVLAREAKMAPYTMHFERLLRTEFYSLQNQNYMIGVRELRQVLARMHHKERDQRYKSIMQGIVGTGELINFDQFCDIFKNLLWEEQKILLSENCLLQYCQSNKMCSVQDFKSFLKEQQMEDAEQEEKITLLMRDAVEDRMRDLAMPHFLQDEFLQYLFTKSNQIFDEKHNEVTMDMTRPLSHYFFSSSHNTYLVGMQVGGESSVEAYGRALRQGCRCIELDTWPERDGKIYIYHGYAFTTKILLYDVLIAIKENAFVTSPYPVILSIEDHCTLPFQREMARLIREVFGSALVTEPLQQGETVAPSPNDLRGKILLKHRKLPEGAAEKGAAGPGHHNDDGEDVVRRGLAYRRHPVMEAQWLKHYFVLTSTRLYYSHACEDEDDAESPEPLETRHLTEPWYHGRSTVTRDAAVDMLQKHAHLGNGTFLVRKSENFVGDFTLSFLYQGQPQHCRIYSRQECDRVRYYLSEDDVFDTLYELVEHYRTHPIHSRSIVSMLGSPVPQHDSHERMPWYHPKLERGPAELCLRRLKQDGVFLVRPSSQYSNHFTVSFRACDEIKHCRIELKDNVYTIGRAEFESLVELVDYYSRNTLFKNTKLRYPVPPGVLQDVLRQNPGPDEIQGPGLSEALYVSNIRVKAQEKYSARHPDELTFPKHAIITNVNQVTQDWWRGDYGGRVQHYFPAFCVVVLLPDAPDERVDHQLLGNLQQGSLDLLGASVSVVPATQSCSMTAVLKVEAGLNALEIGFQSQVEANTWLQDILVIINRDEPIELNVRARERQRDVAKEMSSLVVYFEAVNFNKNLALTRGGVHNQVSSFNEQRMERLMYMHPQKLLQYHKVGFSRVYPKSSRMDSSNFNPMPMWAHGCQCVALNYQTGDKPMQINHGFFKQNGGCGYVLRPDSQFSPEYNPADASTLPKECVPLSFTLRVLGARHLNSRRRGVMMPNVEVEIIGCDYESSVRQTTSGTARNGLCPVWDDSFHFTVLNPALAVLRFVVYEEEVFGDQVTLAQATYPVLCLREGFRSVPLLNAFSEEQELSSLLVHYVINTESDRRLPPPPPPTTTIQEEAGGVTPDLVSAFGRL